MDPSALSRTRWVHVDGDDTAAGAVFRDETGDVPLSRRPRELLVFDANGTVRKLATGPDDRAQEVGRTTWRDDGGRVRFRFDATTYEIVEQSPDRLVIRRD